jgi:hypothetical protein
LRSTFMIPIQIRPSGLEADGRCSAAPSPNAWMVRQAEHVVDALRGEVRSRQELLNRADVQKDLVRHDDEHMASLRTALNLLQFVIQGDQPLGRR